VSYPQPFVQAIIEEFCVPVQINNTLDESKDLVTRFHHVWTPDLRILQEDGAELYRWNGFLPPAEFAAQLLAALGHARLRLRQFDRAETLYADLMRRFPTSFVGPEAQYFTGVTGYRKTGDSKALLQGWHELEKRYPRSEWTEKQNFD
jgi:hypothetical protein